MNIIEFPKPGSARLSETDPPLLGDCEILIEIEYSGISVGTERWVLKGAMEVPGQPPLEYPHVPGYQAAGRIVETGRKVEGFRPGDRVFSRNCRKPESWKSSWWGGHSQFHIADVRRDIVRIPSHVTSMEASYLLLAQVGFNGAYKPHVKKGDTAIVIGDGLVGQFASQVLRSRGAYTILAGLVPERLKKAEAYSADEVYDNRNFDLTGFLNSRFPEGADIVLETASTAKTVQEAAELVKHEGQLVLNGYYPPGESMIDWHWLRRKELTLYCADSRNDTRLSGTMEMISRGLINVKGLITHVFSPEEAGQVYAKLLSGKEDFLGMVFCWQGREKTASSL